MPRAAVRIDVRIGRLRQCEMGGPAFLHHRRPVDGGACQRVAERHALSDCQQPVRLHVTGDRRLDADCFGRAPEQQRITERLRRRQQRQTPRVIRERLELSDEALLDPSGETLRPQQTEAARQLGRRQASRQLQQRQRIPPRFVDDPIPDSLIELESHRRAEQRAGVPIAHAVHFQLGDVLKLLARLARGEHDSDRLRQQAAGDEGEDQRRRADRATARHRRHTAADAHRPPPRTGSTPPTRRGTGPRRRRRSARTPSRAPDAAAPEAAGADRASARTADARSRRPAPSRTRPPPLARRSGPTPIRPGAPAAPSSRFRPRPAEPTTGSRPGGCRRSSRPAARTHRHARGGSCAQASQDRLRVASPGRVCRRRVSCARD